MSRSTVILELWRSAIFLHPDNKDFLSSQAVPKREKHHFAMAGTKDYGDPTGSFMNSPLAGLTYRTTFQRQVMTLEPPSFLITLNS